MDKRLRRIDLRAAAWAIECHDRAPTTDRRRQLELAVWLSRSVEHRDAFARAHRIVEVASRFDESRLINADAILRRFELLRDHGVRSDRRSRWWAVAATIVVAMGLPLLSNDLTAEPVLYTTGLGEERTLLLDDGSTITLNTQTRLAIGWSGRYRQAHLLQGEAFFSVPKKLERPLRIFAPYPVLTNEHTQIDVSRLGPITTVVAVQGNNRILLQDPEQELVTDATLLEQGSDTAPLALWPGDVVSMDARHNSIIVGFEAKSRAEIERSLAWRGGQLAFDDAPVAVVAMSFNRYNRRQIVVHNLAISTFRISGSFTATDPQSFVLALQRAFPASTIIAEVDLHADIITLALRQDASASPDHSPDRVP